MATTPASSLRSTSSTTTSRPRNLRLKRRCQVVLNHCVKARELFLAVVSVDDGLPDQRIEFRFAQLAHAMRLTVRRRRGAPFRGLPLV
jgi:hypothetical protein